MGINKDLNVDPYYDDFDEDKQFNRVLFKPSKAVQARELTQLQTILQKQVERFGSNVYKEGTVISGVNLTSRDDINYVKLEDQVGFDNPALYNEVTDDDGRTKRYKLVGKTNGLEAEIIVGLNGFETASPNLKTFFINYLKSDTVGDTNTEVKEFGRGEKLEIRDWNDTPINIAGVNTTVTAFGSNSDNDDHVGKAFGVSCDEGVIYQKGHFVFVEKQFIIVTRYSNVPGQSATDSTVINPVSVGFSIAENIVDSNQDSSLLDNASGFNNYNAPGADRLQLVPKLVAYETANAPEEFFTLIRYTDGNATRIRDFTEFNVLGDELARRTYEESGNYVVDGYETTLSKSGTQVEAEIEPGKAFVYGREATNVTNIKINVDKVTTTQSKDNQKTSVDYGQYFEIPFLVNGTSSSIDYDVSLDANNEFNSYNLYNNSGNTQIGTCNVLNVQPPLSGASENGRVYVYNIIKFDNFKNSGATHIARSSDTSVKQALTIESGETVAKLYGSNQACMVFDTGKTGLSSTTNNVVVERRNITATLDGQTKVISKESNGQPIASLDNIFALTTDATPVLHKATGVVAGTDVNDSGFVSMTVTFNTATADDELVIFYDMAVTGTSPDIITETTGFMKPVYQPLTQRAPLGVPNVVEIESVFMADSNDSTSATDAVSGETTMTDVTSRFTLVNNQKDGVYDLSYIQLKTGANAPDISNTLLVKFKYLQRNVNGGYITIDSYPSDYVERLSPYTAKNQNTYELAKSIDMRPYIRAEVGISTTANNALIPQNTDAKRTKVGGAAAYRSFANNSVVSSTFLYFLSRIDSVVIDEYGNTLLVKGGEAEDPTPPQLNRQYGIANINIPGGSNEIEGDNRIEVEEISNQGYTMEEIGEIDSRLSSLTEMVRLSIAEQETKSLIIRGDDGEERFKNGILADSFEGLTGADFEDPEFNASVDDGKTIASPSMKEFTVDLKVDTSTLNNTSELFEDNITLSFDETKTPIISQPYATGVRNCVVNSYSFKGKANIYPKYTFHRDVITNPLLIHTALPAHIIYRVTRLQRYIRLSRRSRYRRRIRRYAYSYAKRLNYLYKSGHLSNYPRTASLYSAYHHYAFRSYMRPQVIRISVNGLRPNTEHHFFFGGKNVDTHVRQFRYDWLRFYRRARRRHRGRSGRRFRFISPKYLPYRNWADFFYGRRRGRTTTRYNYTTSTVKTDSRGNLFAYFLVPRGVYTTGQNRLEISDVSTYSNIKSQGTSYASATQTSYHHRLSKSQNTSTRDIDNEAETSSVKREFDKDRQDPIAQTFKMRASDTGLANYGYVSDIDLFFKRKATNQGVTVQIREIELGYPTTKVLPFAEAYLDESDVNISNDGTVATKFEFENPVKLKADTDYCFTVIPDGGSPEYLLYTASVGKRSFSKGTTAQASGYNNDWGDGVLFAPTNDSAWKSYTDEDLKFTVNRYSFVSDSVGTCDLVPNDVEFLTIRDNKKVTGSAKAIDFVDDETAYVVTSTTFSGGTMGDNPDDDNETPEIIKIDSNTLSGLTVGIAVGDYLMVEESQQPQADIDAGLAPDMIVAQVENITTPGGTDTNSYIDLDTPFYEVNGATGVVVTLLKAGKVEYYDSERPDTLHLTESSARIGNYFDDSAVHQIHSTSVPLIVGNTYTITNLGSGGAGDIQNSWRDVSANSALVPTVGTTFVCAVATSAQYPGANGQARPNDQRIIGAASGAQATITSCNSQGISYFEPKVSLDNTTKTSTSVNLLEEVGGVYQLDKPIDENSDVYCTNKPRVIISKSKQIDSLGTGETSIKEDFRLRVSMSNSGFKSVTPTLDDDLSNINVYEYQINDVAGAGGTANYISKEVILNPEMPAEGLKVLLEAYRPPGTVIDVYTRFILEENVDEKPDWILLTNKNPKTYSALNDQEDYREFEYNYTEPTTATPYVAFQMKIAMRHNTAVELAGSSELDGVVLTPSLFPHISSYKAVAVN